MTTNKADASNSCLTDKSEGRMADAALRGQDRAVRLIQSSKQNFASLQNCLKSLAFWRADSKPLHRVGRSLNERNVFGFIDRMAPNNCGPISNRVVVKEPGHGVPRAIDGKAFVEEFLHEPR